MHRCGARRAAEVPAPGRGSWDEQDRRKAKARISDLEMTSLTSGEKGRGWCGMFVRVSCWFSPQSGALGLADPGQTHHKGSLCLNDNEDICRSSGHGFRPSGPDSDIWKQICRDQNARARTRARPAGSGALEQTGIPA